jgi:hypothetical protein
MSLYSFKEACATYKLLRSQGYPEKATLKLVGDRHRLSRMQRNCMFRGVIPDKVAAGRRAKLLNESAVRGEPVALDWYNVLITVESYLHGETLFLADDGVIRDASATHGSYRAGTVTGQAIGELVDEIGRLAPSRIEVYLDLPIAFSGRMAEEVRGRLSRLPLDALVSLSPSADFPLKESDGIVASSDSAVLDACGRAFDLARAVLQERFSFSPPLVHDLFPESLGAPPQ